MKKVYAFFFAILLFGCEKSGAKNSEQGEVSPETKNEVVSSSGASLQALSFDALVGKWSLLDSEGDVDASGDFLAINKDEGRYTGIFTYQGSTVKCIVKNEEEAFFIISDRGEKYTIGRAESTRGNAYNGIWLALGDIDIGNFQREDVLKRLSK